MSFSSIPYATTTWDTILLACTPGTTFFWGTFFLSLGFGLLASILRGPLRHTGKLKASDALWYSVVSLIPGVNVIVLLWVGFYSSGALVKDLLSGHLPRLIDWLDGLVLFDTAWFKSSKTKPRPWERNNKD
jgi:hypothetical protein